MNKDLERGQESSERNSADWALLFWRQWGSAQQHVLGDTVLLHLLWCLCAHPEVFWGFWFSWLWISMRMTRVLSLEITFWNVLSLALSHTVPRSSCLSPYSGNSGQLPNCQWPETLGWVSPQHIGPHAGLSFSLKSRVKLQYCPIKGMCHWLTEYSKCHSNAHDYYWGRENILSKKYKTVCEKCLTLSEIGEIVSAWNDQTKNARD